MVLGVMVDLGWPWWVTTTIAACVVVASALAYVFVRHPAARAIAAVLAIEGVVIAIVAPFVMETTSSSASATAMHAQSAVMMSSALTQAEFARRADANCAALGKRTAPLGSFPRPANLRATAVYLDRFVPMFEHALATQGTLRAPPGIQREATAWMHAMAAMGAGLQSARDSAHAGDVAGVRAAYGASNAAAGASTKLSRQLGLKICFS